MNPVDTVLQEIRRRAVVAGQVIDSGDRIDEATSLQLFESIDSSARNLLRLERHLPVPLYESYLTILQTLLQILGTSVLQNRRGNFQIGVSSRGKINVF